MTTEAVETPQAAPTTRRRTKANGSKSSTPAQPQTPVTMRIDEITLDPTIQAIREKLDPKAVEEYAALSGTLSRAPLTVYEITSGDQQGYKVLSSGHHRLAGASKAGLTEVPVVVLKGTLVDAYENAVRSNRAHGVRFTAKESRRLIEQFITEGRDNEFIMDIVLYSRAGVQNIRNEMRSVAEAGGKLPNLSNKHYRFLQNAPESEQLARAASAHSWPVATLKEAIKILKKGKTTPLVRAAVLNSLTDFFAPVPEPETRDAEYHAQLAAAAAPAVPAAPAAPALPDDASVDWTFGVSPESQAQQDAVEVPTEEAGPSESELSDPELSQLVAAAESEGAVESVPVAQFDYSSSPTRNALSNTMGNLRRAMNEVFADGALAQFSELSLKALLSDINIIDDMIQEFGNRVTDEQRSRLAAFEAPQPAVTPPASDELQF